jgi:hypothetical protein
VVAEMTLHAAAANGNVAEMRRLVASGVNVDELNAHGHTALLHAACNDFSFEGITEAAFEREQAYETTPPHGGAPRCVPDRYAPRPPSPSRAASFFDPTCRASPRARAMPHARHARTP